MYFLLKRIFDIVASVLVLIILFPFLLIVSVWIALDSRGGIFYKQMRVGKKGKKFGLLKFRSMQINDDSNGQITVGADNRITKAGKFIRRYKIDEFPQLLNIIVGQMSIVGPRPEVPKYVEMYTVEQQKVLDILPGLTDYATLEYIDEQKLLGAADDPEKVYVQEVMPAKLALNLKYVSERNLGLDLKLIFKTIFKIFK